MTKEDKIYDLFKYCKENGIEIDVEKIKEIVKVHVEVFDVDLLELPLVLLKLITSHSGYTWQSQMKLA